MKGTLIGDASRVFVLRVALASTAFVSDVLLARLLGVEGKGALALLVLTPVLLASLATLGLDYALNQSTHTHPERRNNLTSTAK